RLPDTPTVCTGYKDLRRSCSGSSLKRDNRRAGQAASQPRPADMRRHRATRHLRREIDTLIGCQIYDVRISGVDADAVSRCSGKIGHQIAPVCSAVRRTVDDLYAFSRAVDTRNGYIDRLSGCVARIDEDARNIEAVNIECVNVIDYGVHRQIRDDRSGARRRIEHDAPDVTGQM